MSINPVFSAGTSREPPRMRNVPSISCSSWSSWRNTISPFGNSTRLGSCGWNWCNGGTGTCFHAVGPPAPDADAFRAVLDDEGFLPAVWAEDKLSEQTRRRIKADVWRIFIIIAALLFLEQRGPVAPGFRSWQRCGSPRGMSCWPHGGRLL